MLLGFPLDCTDAVKGSADLVAVFYFGDFSFFVIQENSEGLEIEIMKEMYTNVNEVGLKLYNLLAGKLIHSEVEPTVYSLEIK
ncbi:HK97 family phage major capsid protein [Bacillus sp. RC206]|nr:phage major capsid protein [Bacillus mycoides]